MQPDVTPHRSVPPTSAADPSAALLRAACAGDRAARADLLARYGPRIWALCRRLADDPEDAYQDAWERIFGALVRFDPSGTAALSTWLHTVVHRALVDRHRRAAVRGNVIALPDLVSPEPGPDVRVDERRRADALDRALAELSEEHRRVVLLHHVGGVPLEDIAAAEGVPVGTVKSRLHRARARLVTRLERP